MEPSVSAAGSKAPSTRFLCRTVQDDGLALRARGAQLRRGSTNSDHTEQSKYRRHHLSISPNTTSMVPMIAATSASWCPRLR